MQTGVKKSKYNIGLAERMASVFGGGALIVYAMSRPSRTSLPVSLTGGYFIYRGIRGWSYLYEAMEIYRSEQDGETGIYVEESITINRPKEDVYRYWRDIENLSKMMDHLQQAKATSETTSEWVTAAPFGQTFKWKTEIVDERENELIMWRSLRGSQVRHSGKARFRDAPGNRGTEVLVVLHYELPGGSAMAAFTKLFGEEPGQQLESGLRRFKAILEAGEVPTVYGQTSGRHNQVSQERMELDERRRKDVVQEASEESFPASDAPAWTTGPAI